MLQLLQNLSKQKQGIALFVNKLAKQPLETRLPQMESGGAYAPE
jgi:hypothetical protein